MKKILLLIATLTLLLGMGVSTTLYAQKNEVSLKAGHPFPIGDTFLSQYDGVWDVGVSYGRSISNTLMLQLSFQYDRLNFGRIDVNANVYMPKVGIAYRVYKSQKFSLFSELQVGYAAVKFDTNNGAVDNRRNGVSFWIGLNPRYSVSRTVDLALSFGYQSAYLDTPAPPFQDRGFNKELHELSLSLQTIFHF